MDYCEDFFTKANFEKIPLGLRQTRTDDYGKDHVRWKSSILKRLFDTDYRVQEHHLFRFGNYYKDDRWTAYISNGDVVDVRLTDYAKNNNLSIKFNAQIVKEKVNLNFHFDNLKKDKEYFLRVRIADPSTIDNRAYRTGGVICG